MANSYTGRFVKISDQWCAQIDEIGPGQPAPSVGDKVRMRTRNGAIVIKTLGNKVAGLGVGTWSLMKGEDSRQDGALDVDGKPMQVAQSVLYDFEVGHHNRPDAIALLEKLSRQIDINNVIPSSMTNTELVCVLDTAAGKSHVVARAICDKLGPKYSPQKQEDQPAPKQESGSPLDAEQAHRVSEVLQRTLTPIVNAINEKFKAQGAWNGKIEESLELVANTLTDLRKAVQDIDTRTPREIRVQINDRAPVEIKGTAHAMLPDLLAIIATGQHVWMTGPSGSGKSHLAKQAADVLCREFYSTGAISTKHELVGYVSPSGDPKSLRTPFRDAFELGGVFSWDDVDGSSPQALVAFNEALANGRFAFPDGMVYAHPDFVCIASANTWGMGANAEYVGRSKIDAATLTRFVRIGVDYDLSMERQIAGNDEWTSFVQAVRVAVAEIGIKILITPRHSIQGAKLLAAGMDRAKVEAYTVFAGVDSATIDKIRAKLPKQEGKRDPKVRRAA